MVSLAFLLALAVFGSRWWPYRGQAAANTAALEVSYEA